MPISHSMSMHDPTDHFVLKGQHLLSQPFIWIVCERERKVPFNWETKELSSAYQFAPQYSFPSSHLPPSLKQVLGGSTLLRESEPLTLTGLTTTCFRAFKSTLEVEH